MTTDREVKYKISADANGGEKIKQLADEISFLVKTGGDAAPAFKKFSDELDRLAGQNQLVTEFSELQTKTSEFKSALDQATESANKSGAIMRERAKDVQLAAEAENTSRHAVEKSNAAILESQVQLRKVKADIAAYKAEIAASGDVTGKQQIALRDATIQLKQYEASLAAAKVSLDQVLPAQIQNSTALKSAQAELAKSTTEYNQNAVAVAKLKTEYDQTEVALNGIGEKMAAAGVSTSDLTAEYTRISSSVKKLAQEFAQERDALAQKTATERAAVEAIKTADAAYKEVTATLRAEGRVLSELLNSKRINNQIELEAAQVSLNLAKAKKDEKVISEALLEVRTLESKALAIQSQIANQDAANELALVNAKREHLIATDRLTAAIDTEIAAESIAIKSKIELAAATVDVARGQNEVAKQINVERELASAARTTDQAYQEKIATLRAEATVVAEQTNLTKSQIQVELQAAKSELQAAKAKGDKKAASEATIRVLTLESEVTRLQAQAMREEAVAEELELNVKRQHLTATHQLTAALLSEIEAERLAIQSKLNAATATETLAASQLNLTAKTKESGGTLQALTGFARGALAPIAALIGMFAGATEFVRVNLELENIARTLRIVTGSSEAAKNEMAWVKEVANRLGLELVSTAKAYSQFAAATKGSSLAGEETRRVFEAVAGAMAAAGRSSAETEGALNALGQMVSKGVVQMEELRGQLGDRLPGAMKIAAESSGLTTQELIKMIESGKVLAEDLLPKLAVGLKTSFAEQAGAVSTSTQEWNRFRNAVSEVFEMIGESGLIKGLISVVSYVTKVAVAVGATADVLTHSLGGAILFTSDLITNFISFLNPWGISLEEFAQRTKVSFNAVGSSVEQSLDRGAQAINKFDGAAQQASKSTEKVTGSTEKAAEAAAAAEKSWIGLTAEYTKVEKKASDAAAAAEKQVEARRAEAKTIQEINAIRGDELAKLKETLEVNQKTADSLTNLAKQRAAELAALEKELEAKQKYVAANHDESAAHKKQIEEIEKLVVVKKAEYETSLAQAKGSELLVVASKAELEAHKDNSAHLRELHDNYVALVKEVDLLRKKKAEGVDVTDRLAEAEKNLAAASRLYRDAVADQVKAINTKLSLKEAENNLAQAGIKLAIEGARSDYEVAKALGDQEGARRAANEMRRLEIELAKLQAQLLKAEADAALEIVKVKREEAKARGELTKQMEMELRVEELSAQAKSKQAEIQQAVAERMDRLSQITEYSTNAINKNTDAANENADGLDNAAKAADNLANSYSNAAGAANRLGRAKTGTGKKGGADDNFTVTAETVESLTKRFQDAGYDYGSARVSAERLVGKQIYVDVDAEVEKARTEMEAKRNGGGGGLMKSRSEQSTTGGGSLNTYTVNINLNGRTTSVNTASEKDAQALTTLLGQIGTDKSRAN